MRNLRRLLLSLVLVSLAGASWDEEGLTFALGAAMSLVVNYIKWIMLVAGLPICSTLSVVFAPQDGLMSMLVPIVGFAKRTLP